MTCIFTKMMGLNGVEPLTSSLSATRSNQLSYKPFYRCRTWGRQVGRNPSYDWAAACQGAGVASAGCGCMTDSAGRRRWALADAAVTVLPLLTLRVLFCRRICHAPVCCRGGLRASPVAPELIRD